MDWREARDKANEALETHYNGKSKEELGITMVDEWDEYDKCFVPQYVEGSPSNSQIIDRIMAETGLMEFDLSFMSNSVFGRKDFVGNDYQMSLRDKMSSCGVHVYRVKLKKAAALRRLSEGHNLSDVLLDFVGDDDFHKSSSGIEVK